MIDLGHRFKAYRVAGGLLGAEGATRSRPDETSSATALAVNELALEHG